MVAAGSCLQLQTNKTTLRREMLNIYNIIQVIRMYYTLFDEQKKISLGQKNETKYGSSVRYPQQQEKLEGWTI